MIIKQAARVIQLLAPRGLLAFSSSDWSTLILWYSGGT